MILLKRASQKSDWSTSILINFSIFLLIYIKRVRQIIVNSIFENVCNIITIFYYSIYGVDQRKF